MKRVTVGGQAVIEGVMMKEKNHYAVAIRKPNKEIICIKKESKSISNRFRIFKLPILRGVLAFVESMVLGIGILTLSAEYFEEEPETKEIDTISSMQKEEKLETNEEKKGISDALIMIFAVVFAIGFSVGLFILLPSFIAHLLRGFVKNRLALNVVEGVIKLALFLSYVVLISLMKDIRRVYEYHGAEHKTINCLEHELELTVENVRKQSRLHKRCGTSFLLFVMVISIIFFWFIKADTLLVKMGLRLLLIPAVAGVSYEILKFAGRSESFLMNILSAPGMALQRLTTREPDDEQIEVAITAVKEVLEDEQPATYNPYYSHG